MANYAFRYIAEENFATAAEVNLVKAILELPIEDALELTVDELDEDFDIALEP